MIQLLSRWLIPDRDNVSSPAVRRAYGTLCGAVGVALNILLFIGKFFAGRLSGSIAVTAAAFNNLSDAGSSAVTFSLLALGIMAASVCVKLYMWLYNRQVGRRIHSAAMEATAMDSLSDTAATAAVLLSMLVGKWTNLAVDGYVGLVVALFILFSAYKAAKETLSPLLGQAPDPELVQEIRDIVMAHDTVQGVHDLVVHDYGPGRCMISLHAEVPAHGDIMEMHDVIDNIEKELAEKLHCQAVIHMDPIVTDDASVGVLRRQIAEVVKQVDPRMTIHDFRMVQGTTHTNLIFDAVLPFSSGKTPEQAAEEIRQLVRQLNDTYFAVVTVEHSYTD